MTEEEQIPGTNVSTEGAPRLLRLLHCIPTDSEVQNCSSQISKHEAKVIVWYFKEMSINLWERM